MPLLFDQSLYAQQLEAKIREQQLVKEYIQALLMPENLNTENIKTFFKKTYSDVDLTDNAHDSFFIKLIEKQGFKKESIPGDGACLFHSIALLIQHQNEHLGINGADLRKLTVNYMKEHSDEFLAYFWTDTEEELSQEESDLETKKNYDQYLATMSLTETFGSDLEITAICKVLGVSIVIYDLHAYRNAFIADKVSWENDKFTSIDLLCYGDTSKQTLYIHRSRAHYSALTRLSNKTEPVLDVF